MAKRTHAKTAYTERDAIGDEIVRVSERRLTGARTGEKGGLWLWAAYSLDTEIVTLWLRFRARGEKDIRAAAFHAKFWPALFCDQILLLADVFDVTLLFAQGEIKDASDRVRLCDTWQLLVADLIGQSVPGNATSLTLMGTPPDLRPTQDDGQWVTRKGRTVHAGMDMGFRAYTLAYDSPAVIDAQREELEQLREELTQLRKHLYEANAEIIRLRLAAEKGKTPPPLSKPKIKRLARQA